MMGTGSDDGQPNQRSDNKKRRPAFAVPPLTAPYRPLPPLTALLVLSCRLYRIHAHLEALFALVLELHLAVDRREQRVVRGPAHVPARMELGAALDHDDGSGPDELAAETLHAEVLRIRVAPVARRADAFFMSHLSRPLRPRF